jgi:hypothetical protein
MTATSRATHRAAAVTSPSESASRPRPVGSALAAFVAPWGFVVANTAYTIATWHGGSDSTGAESLALFGAHPTLARVAINAVLIGSMLIVPAVVGILRAQPRSRLANVGGWLMIFGYICYFGVLLSNVTIVAMAEYGGPAAGLDLPDLRPRESGRDAAVRHRPAAQPGGRDLASGPDHLLAAVPRRGSADRHRADRGGRCDPAGDRLRRGRDRPSPRRAPAALKLRFVGKLMPGEPVTGFPTAASVGGRAES